MILVVDDNEFNLALTRAVLERAGYDVEAVNTGEAAVAAITEHQPELILMDVGLPGRSGLEITRELKAQPETAEIPIVALTAHAMRGDEANALEAGCAGYIGKPIDTRTFAEEIARFLK